MPDLFRLISFINTFLNIFINAFCQCMQVVHSDIKSGNVLLNEDASIAKIADVGTSRLLEQTCTTGTMMCTFSYAAPEQMFGIRDSCNEKVPTAVFSCAVSTALYTSHNPVGINNGASYTQVAGLMLKS